MGKGLQHIVISIFLVMGAGVLSGCIEVPTTTGVNANNSKASTQPQNYGHLVGVESGLNVRQGPSTKYKVVGSLKPKDRFAILQEANGWYKIEKSSNGRSLVGWASGKYVQPEGSGLGSPFAGLGKSWDEFKASLGFEAQESVENDEELKKEIGNMKNRTRLEGTVVGALAGFVVGSFTGKTQVTVAATLIGAATGLVAGDYVANKKEEYANDEAYLNACIEEADKYNQVAKESNKNLKKQIAKKQQRIQVLKSQIAQGQDSQDEIQAELKDMQEKQEAVDQIIQGLEAGIASQEKAVQSVSPGNDEQVAALQKEIRVSQQEVRELKAQREELAGLMMEMSQLTV